MKEIESELDRIEEAVLKGDYSLKEMGFWRIVAKVKKEPELIDRFADQIGRIDQAVFKAKTPVSVPLKVGHFIEMTMTFVVIIVLYFLLSSGIYTGVSLIAGTFVLMGTLHPLAHWIVGRMFGIEFTFYFPDGPALIEPTIKTDYASYLKTAPIKRAIMHATGPVVSTLVIVQSLVVAAVIEAPPWTFWLLLAFLIFNAIFEVLPPVWVKLGVKGLAKSDTYRVWREWKIHKFLEGHKS
jgi:hypothetical protein